MTTQNRTSSVSDELRSRSIELNNEQAFFNSSNNIPNTTSSITDEKVKRKKTIGRTPNGTIFTVPHTHDMVSQLLDPRQPKNLSDVFLLSILSIHIISFYCLPTFLKQPVFAIIFLFWRCCYNLGIGYLLHIQSNSQQLVKWAIKAGLATHGGAGKNKNLLLYSLIKHELEAKIPENYQFEKFPIEYNTWLIFRRVVDLILMCDFTSYCLFAIACGHRPNGEVFSVCVARWTIGILLVGFNLWVKLDAHRVVKDYAWYWGDFFYLVDQKLTFDGVFEMAPHPMYSVGYAGYYGISMMAASYSVLLISIIAHAAQFGFLIHVENPHIEKTYNPPPIRKRGNNLHNSDRCESSGQQMEDVSLIRENGIIEFNNLPFPPDPISAHSYIGFGGLDLFRTTDSSRLLIQVLMVLLTVLTPSTPEYQAFFIFSALFWRLWYTVGLGFILDRQSKLKIWTRHFVKYGETTEVAWKEWKGMYHLSMTMCYASFIAASWKMYSFPDDWGYGLVLFKHVLGVGLIALQAWTALSIYESLGEFGWFFGDFFFDKGTKLTYSGIYRYLNNPERIMGLASVWGATLITGRPAIFFLALISHILTFGFIQLVEKPHMQKLYGRGLRAEAGLTKSIRRSLPPPLKKFQGSVDKVLEETSNFVREFVDTAQPKFAAGVSTIVRDTSSLFSQYPARLTLTRLAPDLAGYDPRDYSIQIEGVSLSTMVGERVTGKESFRARFPQLRSDHYEPFMFEYGTPITMSWRAPLHCSKKDWIGLYMVADNASREVTRVSSAGRWIPTFPDDYDLTLCGKETIASHQIIRGEIQADGSTKDYIKGKMIFEGDKLWWTLGVFEFRYHHDGKHNVMAISLPFEIYLRKFAENELNINDGHVARSEIEKALLPLVRNCFDRSLDIAPNSVEDNFGAMIKSDGKYTKRVVFAIHHMFGIELAPKVVLADGNVRKLAWRIYVAKQALAPYSMSNSQGTTTPTSPIE